jgi:nitrogen fixation NifU-like protein
VCCLHNLVRFLGLTCRGIGLPTAADRRAPRLPWDIGFEGTGCTILLASASLLTLAVNGKTVEGARAVAERFVAMVTATSPPDGDGLGDPAVLAGVRDYPGRVKCATLPRHALRAATEGP